MMNKLPDKLITYINVESMYKGIDQKFAEHKSLNFLNLKGDMYGSLINKAYLQKQYLDLAKGALITPAESEFNLLNAKDAFYGMALGFLIRNCQTVDKSQTTLTSAGKLFEQVAGSYTPKATRREGVFGSVSYWLKDITYAGLTPPELIEKILIRFWSYLNIPLTDSVYTKFTKFKTFTEIDNIPFTSLELTVKQILEANDIRFKDEIRLLRQNFIDSRDLNDLKTRYFLLELPKQLPYLLALFDAQITNIGGFNYVRSPINLYGWTLYMLRHLPGGGPLLVLQALKAECAFTIANILSSLTPQESLQPISSFLTNASQITKEQIVTHLIWMFDINRLLIKYNTFGEIPKENKDIEDDINSYNLDINLLNLSRINL